MNERIVDFVHCGSERVVFRLQFFFQSLYLKTNIY